MSLFDSARFAISVAETEQLNHAALAMVPEVAIVGRSNAGKSSTINVLANRRQLAYASKTPGRTQLLNFFLLSDIEPDAAGERVAVPRAYLVDLPGYGFAKVDDATRTRWNHLVGDYLRSRRMLRGVILVMDARRPLQEADEDLLRWLVAREDPDTVRVHCLLNKSDQLGRIEQRAALAATEARAESLPMPTSVQLFSALKRSGVEELRAAVVEMIGWN
jgi:GTP-binding protein